MARRPSAYLPEVEARPVSLDELDVPVNRDGVWTVPLAAFCPRPVALGTFEVINTGWPASVTFEVLPQHFPVPGAPQVYVSTDTARFGEQVTVYADASNTAPGEYLIVVNLRGLFGQRVISGNARLLLNVENSPVNCQ